MYSHACRQASAASTAAAAFLRSWNISLAVIVASLLLAGCASAPPRLMAGPDPADPHGPAARVAYNSATASYVSQRPATPKPWRQQNESVTPPAKSGQ